MGEMLVSDVNELRKLAIYYKDILASITQQSGKHLTDLGSVFRYGLTGDLGIFDISIKGILEEDNIVIKTECSSIKTVSSMIAKSDFEEEQEAEDIEGDFVEESMEKISASAKLVAIYRKQEQDPYNRETTIGFPIIAGKYGNNKICAPLFYFTVNIDLDPSNNKVILTKNFTTPVFNSHLIDKLATYEGEAELVREKILPLIYENDFDLNAIDKTIVSLINDFKGLKTLSTATSTDINVLKSAMQSREKKGLKIYNTISIVNSARSNAFLQDELQQLASLEDINGETVIETLLAEAPESISMDYDDPDGQIHTRPLIFPLQSNIAQRRVARKAEQARLMVVQGPPGTGKSQTIANLVCDLVSQGKTILVTSHQNKALEVIEEKLPSIEYLSMHLLKGENESLDSLVNQLENFDVYVSDTELGNVTESYERKMREIREKEIQIKSLATRFSELKTFERNQYPTYYKYHKIRQYDHISEQDNVMPGLENQVAHDLREWEDLFSKVGNNFADLRNLFCVGNGEDVLDEVERVGDTLSKLLAIYDVCDEFSADSELVSMLRKFAGLGAGNAQETISYLNQIGSWLENNGEEYLRSFETISSLGFDMSDLSFHRKKLIQLNGEILSSYVQKAENCKKSAQELFEVGVPRIFDFIPQQHDLNEIEMAVRTLEKTNFLSWHIIPSTQGAKKLLIKKGIKSISFNAKESLLSEIIIWLNYWRLKYQVVNDINLLKQARILDHRIILQSSPSELLKQSSTAVSYLDFLSSINQIPKVSISGEITNFINELLESIKDYQTLSQLKVIIKKSQLHMEKILEFKQLSVENNVVEKTPIPIESFEKAIYNLEFSETLSDFVSRGKTLIGFYPDYFKVLKLELSTLKTMPNTLQSLRLAILNGKTNDWLNHGEKAIEAHKLKKFITKDLRNNPDDIAEVAANIRKLNDEKRDLILIALTMRRKIALKSAANDAQTKQQITKLKKILSRKKKTASFVQLKDQVQYEKLLDVFPCWNMSIDDVARVFPLQAGLFDYLIVDEASQCNQATALHLAYRAKRMIVVGDQKQMKNPNVRFLSDKLVRMLLTKHGLDTHPKVEFINARESLLALAEYSSNTNEFLNEHFRCEPPIIAWSNKNFYDNKLRMLTPIRHKRFKPCLEIHLVKGADDDTEKKVNILEAEAVAHEVERIILSGEAEGLSIGVMSLYREQATLLQNLIYEKFEDQPQVIKKHQLIISTADGFQGDERDIIFYSMRYGPSSSPGTINAIQLEKERINVAFSRVRRKMVCFISRPVEEFPNGIIKEFLRHAKDEQNNPTDRLGLIGEDSFDSEFEKEVCHNLRNQGLTVYTQVPCYNFRIDMVVIDKEGRRMAVECDGDFQYEDDGNLPPEDYQRQDIIERSGWFVHRIPARRYYENAQKAIDLLLKDLAHQPLDTYEEYNYINNIESMIAATQDNEEE